MVSSRVHPASQVDPASHSPELLELMDAKLNRNVVAVIVDQVVDAVDYAFSRPGPSASPKERRGRSLARSTSPFSTFVTRVLVNAEVKMPTVLTTLAYVERARPHLQIALEEWACERVFLGALVVASKYTNDSTLKNVHWAYCTGVFGKSDVGRIEREFLDVLAYELAVTDADLAPYLPALMAAARVSERRRAAAPASAATPAPAHRRRSSASSTRTAVSDESVPELSPAASPTASSSSGSASPQTPPALAPAPAPAKAPAKPKRHSPLDLLRALPLPYHRREASPAPKETHARRASLVWA